MIKYSMKMRRRVPLVPLFCRVQRAGSSSPKTVCEIGAANSPTAVTHVTTAYVERSALSDWHSGHARNPTLTAYRSAISGYGYAVFPECTTARHCLA